MEHVYFVCFAYFDQRGQQCIGDGIFAVPSTILSEIRANRGVNELRDVIKSATGFDNVNIVNWVYVTHQPTLPTESED